MPNPAAVVSITTSPASASHTNATRTTFQPRPAFAGGFPAWEDAGYPVEVSP